MKIANKAFFFIMFLMLFIFVCSYGALYFLLPSFYRHQIVSDMEKKSDVLLNELSITSSREERQSIINRFTIDNNVQPILSSSEEDVYSIPVIINDSSTLKAVQGGSIGSGTVQYSLIIDQTNIYIINKELLIDNQIYKLSIAVPLKPVNEAMGVVAGMIPYLLLFSVVICSFATLFYSKAITKPIIAITKSTQRMKEMDIKAYSPISSRDEIGELSSNLNTMYQKHLETIQQLNMEMDRVSELEKQRMRFMKAASHELKTPVAALKGIVEGMIDKVGIYKNRDAFLLECSRLLDELDDLTKKISTASANDVVLLQTENINLSKFIEGILYGLSPLCQQKEVTIKNEISETIIVASSLIPLEQIISNVITNAILYADEPFEVIISLSSQPEICLTVFNTCIPLSDEDMQHIFEPFYRLEKSKILGIEGSGLGLTIVSQLAETLHHDINFKSMIGGMSFNIFFGPETRFK